MVQVPKLNRIQPGAALPQNDRINLQVRDNASIIQGQTRAISGLAETGLDIYQEFEDDKIRSLSNDAELEYSEWSRKRLNELKTYGGDPTDVYAQFETEMDEKYDEIVNKRPEINERVRTHLSSNLRKVKDGQRLQMLNQRGAQQETYDNNLFESTVKLKKDNLAISAGYIRKDDLGSFLPFDENIAEIKTTISQRMMDKGLAEKLPDDAKSWDHFYKDPEGKIVKLKLNDIAKARIASDLSQGVSSSINSMIASGYSDEAKQAYEKYKNYIDPKTQFTLSNRLKITDTKNAAFEEVAKIEGKPESEQMRLIEAIQDPELKSEVLKIKDTNDRRRENIRERRYKANYDILAKNVMNKMNSDTPFYGLADLENDPTYKAVIDGLDAKGQKAIRDMVITPKETDNKAEAKIQDLFFGNDPNNEIETISPETFSTYLAGLSKSDRKKYTNMYNRARTQTAGEERAAYKRANEMLRNQFLVDGLIQKDKFGKISGEDEVKLINAQNKLLDHLEAQKGAYNEKQMKDFVKEFSAAEVKGKVFNPTARTIYNTQSRQNASSPSTKKGEVVLSPKQIVEFKKKFREQNGYFPVASDEKFKNFVERNM